MEKAILKTLIYADIFDYPLKVYEIHKWLIGRKATLRQVESALGGLVYSAKLKVQSGYYFLPRRDGLVAARKQKEKQSERYLRKAKVVTSILKIVPWIKLIGISGGLAMNNASKRDDIDLFIITSKNRLWISRLLALGLLSLTGQRRKVGEKGRKIAGKMCLNILLEEDRLEQNNKDIYLAHEVLQMRPLWHRGRVYEKYLRENRWVFKFIPNWIGPQIQNSKIKMKNDNLKFKIFDQIEKLAKRFQLKIMSKPQGMERIEDGALYFHPHDIRPKILKLYKQKISRT